MGLHKSLQGKCETLEPSQEEHAKVQSHSGQCGSLFCFSNFKVVSTFLGPSLGHFTEDHFSGNRVKKTRLPLSPFALSTHDWGLNQQDWRKVSCALASTQEQEPLC